MTLQLGPPTASPDEGTSSPTTSTPSIPSGSVPSALQPAPRWNHRQELRELYRAGRRPTRIVVPSRQFVAVLGSGDPAGASYSAAIASLFRAAYRVRFAARRAGLVDAPVMPLEGQWWSADGTPFTLQDRSGWQWRMMIPLAPHLDGEAGRTVIETALAAGAREGGDDVPVQLHRFEEGDAVQIMHRGPWSEESTTLAVLHGHLADSRLVARGCHHEIYLGDPARTAPARLRTILRQPVSTVGPAPR